MHIRAIYVLLVLLAFCPIALAAGASGESGSKSNDLAAQVKDLQARLAVLEQQATAAQDYIDVCNLEATCGYYVGQDRVRAYLHKLPDLKYGTLFNHMQLQPVVNIDPGGKTAKGRWRAIIQFGQLHRSAQWAEATYENTYVKENGVWKIETLHAYFTYYVDYYKGWDKGGNPPPGPIPGFPPDKPPTETYGLYPDVYVPPYHYKNPVTGK